VLFVSHNMIAIRTLSQRAILLDAGRLKDQGMVSQIVTSYLRSGLAANDIKERIWKDIAIAPGNDTTRLHRIRVEPEGGKPGDMINMQTPLRIEVEYWKLLAGVHLDTTLHIYNDQGILAFTTGTESPDPVYYALSPAGLIRSICHIPGRLLNSGSYGVSILMIRSGSDVIFEMNEAIGFEVVDNSERMLGWFGKEPGVLAPNLVWETKYLGNKDMV
jgi:lipopolysaccharide transport system ATP-binding protein